MEARVLIVEDDAVIREGTQAFLTELGYHVETAADGETGLQLGRQEAFDAIILDIMLPKINGIDVLRKIRQEKDTPVLMLTALDDDTTQVESFDERADDYVTKPFSLAVLQRRLAALLRRKASYKIWEYGGARVDFTAYTATYHGEIVDVKPKEMQLLALLLEYEGQVLSREQILDHLWGIDDTPTDRVVDVYIKNLRKKLHLACIVTVKGVGYKYEAS